MRTFIGKRGAIGVALGSTAMFLGAPAGASSELLGCDAPVYDPAGLVDSVTRQIVATTGTAWGIDLRVRVEDPPAGPQARLDELLRSCPGWTVNGTVQPELVVIIMSPKTDEAVEAHGSQSSTPGANAEAAARGVRFTLDDQASVSSAITAAMITLSTAQTPVTLPNIPTFTVPRHRSFWNDSNWNWIRFAIKPALFLVVAVLVQISRLARRRGRSAPSSPSSTPPRQTGPTPKAPPPPRFEPPPFQRPAPPPPPVAPDDVLASWGISSTIPPPPPPGEPK